MIRRALVTNDDGIESEGLRQLALAATRAGLEVVVAAPRHESSGSSAALTAVQHGGQFILEPRQLEALEGVRACAVDATPAFITLIALRGAFGEPPDVVLSGVNRGANTGSAVLHSGTVGAVLTARSQGCRGMAVSLAHGGTQRWDTVARVVDPALRDLLAARNEQALNVNVPDVALGALQGVRRARLASFGTVQTTIEALGRGRVRIGVTEAHPDDSPGTDAALLEAGFATVTALEPLCESA